MMVTELKKYPRIPHLPWSEGRSADDIGISDGQWDLFWRKPVVITEKMDGECTTITKEKVHARSLDSKDHPSRHWLKAWAASFQWKIPPNMRLVGENLYAAHSIGYTDLPAYFLLFGVFMDDRYMSWQDVSDIADYYNIPTVPILYQGKLTNRTVSDIETVFDPEFMEGYVIRNSNSFFEDTFCDNIAKYVRKGHVCTDEHWMNKPVVKNGLING